MKTMKYIGFYLLSVCVATSNVAWAQSRGGSGTGVVTPFQTYTAATTTTTTTTMYGYGQPTIKEAAAKAMQNNSSGKSMAMAGAAITGAGVMMTCFSTPPNPMMCKIFAVGLAATMAATMMMGNAGDQSKASYDAVNAPPDVKNPNGAPVADETPDPGKSSLKDSPEWQTAVKAKTKLEQAGWKVNPVNKTVTTPSGTVVSSKILDSPGAMAAAGASPADIKAFESAMQKAALAAGAEKKPAAADGSDMFGDGGAGGGGSKSAGINAGLGGLPAIPNQKLGLNRNPAQVAGMKKDYNGSPIGVAGDSLFDMIDRRYKLHNENGSFISP